ncbi:CHAT domain-containing protein [Streptomyces sp. NPDC048272]|uniref:CHAT domain-containing protein n=1 Tax=Streptomyces sp. NPDC048272 TaxID=3154616 RepID=UPI0034280C82
MEDVDRFAAWRIEREEALEALAGLAPDDPRAVELHCKAGEASYALHEASGGRADRNLAAEAFAHAFRHPAGGPIPARHRIMYGHLLALDHDEEPGPVLAARVHSLLTQGLAGLPDDHDHQDMAVFARRLLAFITKIRFLETADDPALLDPALLHEALEANRLALDDADGPDPELDEALGGLWQYHGGLTNEAASYATSARHYAQVPAGGGPDRDLPLIRQARSASLVMWGHTAADRAALQEGYEEGLRALAAVRGASPEPTWARDTRLRVTFARTLIAGTWADEEEGARAEAEIAELLSTEAEMDALPVLYLGMFGRLLCVRGHARLDAALLDHAVALLTRAFDRWDTAKDGAITETALALAAVQHLRFDMDGDTERLRVVVRAVRRVRQGERLSPEVTDMALGLLGAALVGLPESARPDAGPDVVSDEELARAYERFQRTAMEGEFDFGMDNHLLADDPRSRERWERRFSVLFEGWERTEPGSLSRAERAGTLLAAMPMLDPHGDRMGAEREERLVGAMSSYADAHPEWRARGHAGLAGWRFAQGMAGSPPRLTQALEHFDLAIAAGNTSPWVRYGRHQAMRQLAQLRGVTEGSAAGGAEWDAVVGALGLSPHMDELLKCQDAAAQVRLAARRGDLAAADRGLGLVAGVVGRLEPGSTSHTEAWVLLETARMSREDLADRLGAPPAPTPAGRPSIAEMRLRAAKFPRQHHAHLLGAMALVWQREALQRADVPRIREALAVVEEALALSAPGSEAWIRFASNAGSVRSALVMADPRPGSPDRARDLERAITLLEGAARAMEGPEHRLWAVTTQALGRCLRVRADPARRDRENGRRLGLESLRGFVWSSLLQSGSQDAAEAGRLATELSGEVVGWCLADGAPDDAVRALDACRGLVLHAATTSRSVPERLIAVGREDLAREWLSRGADEAADDVPSTLRRSVVLALTEGDTRLLDPPSPTEIGAGLRAHRKDALVYLVPSTSDCPGTALVVTSRGETREVPLSSLREDAAPLRRYRPAAAGRDMQPVPGYGGPRPEPAPPLRDQLDRLCSWAWRVAVRPLLDVFQVSDRPGRVPRLVLVPMGSLGLVPWHAAFAADASGRRAYAIERAEFSYAASARLLCEVAGRPRARHEGTALVVGDPTGDLPYAGEEADAVRRVFYPDGRYLGLRTGDGSPDQVARWLREHGDEGAVVHLACHGTVTENRPRSSYLSLKGGELTAEELADAVHGRLGLVVLAACRSQVSGRGHNEAYSLSSAFLVAGSRSVIGSLWPVPDDATSVLMFMTHHFLRREQEPPARALRRAQLWMLDPGRQVPDGLPPALTARLAHLDPHDLSAWAGFTHLGQ